MPKQRNLLDKLMRPFLSSSQTRAKDDEIESIAAKEQRMMPYSTLLAATRNFSDKNKLGEGGFGAVYKGTLKDGRVVAVKRLSGKSMQGEREFRNEALLLSKVQHRNIVNLIGYCTTTGGGGGGGDGALAEKLLVYEYIPHESLDKLLFDKEKRWSLDWTKRFDIINGVARGLLYLHEDCHTTIIHRDIKASNILLDEKWVPKIADFGMARLYPEQQTHVQTRIAGTNGYMAPEYFMRGQLSTKADTYSFGVLVIELISGIKNSQFFAHSEADSLPELAWKRHRKGQSLAILDGMLKGTANEEQVLSCVHIALLCVQADPKLRPDMKHVVVMLSKKPSSLPEATRPAFSGSSYWKSSGSGITVSSGVTASSHATTSGTSDCSGVAAPLHASASASKSSHISTSASNPRSSSTPNATNRTAHRKQIVMEKTF